jgi:hypothetical protein
MSIHVHLIWQVLPKYPLPTHDVVVRGGAPNAFSVRAIPNLMKSNKEKCKSADQLIFVCSKALWHMMKLRNQH